MLKKIKWGMLACLLAFAGCKESREIINPSDDDDETPVNPPATLYSNVIQHQIAFITAAQLPSGAIMDTSVPGSRICAYFANIACMALLKVPDSGNIETVKRYLAWYMSKLNGDSNPYTGGSEVAGSIYDYFGEAETCNGTYDSVDSYAATFLTLVRQFAALSDENSAWLQGHQDALEQVASALAQCIDDEHHAVPTTFGPDDDDRLSIDSYVHGAKYLMDNCEVNEGLRSWAALCAGVLASDPQPINALLDANTSAIETELWRDGAYNWHDNGSIGSSFTNWSTFYPDAVSQLFPGMLGVLDPQSDRANRLYTRFNVQYPAWSSGVVYSGTFPWALVSYAAAMIHDKARVDEYLAHVLAQNNAGGQLPYWYIAEAAFTILAADKAKDIADTDTYVPLPIEDEPTATNLALDRVATASAGGNAPQLANDGDLSTRWFSAVADDQWWQVDLGSVKPVNEVRIKWEGAYATDYAVLVSEDGTDYQEVFQTDEGEGGDVVHGFDTLNARYVKLQLTKRVEEVWSFSFWEVEVY